MGTSGKIVPNLEITIRNENGKILPKGEPGEIVIRGENVMEEYWHNSAATAKTIKDGWLYTGDMGYMDEDDYLVVLGRYKSLLISDDGEKYSPEGIEESLANQSQYIEQIMLYNNQKPYTVSCIVPNKPAVLAYLKEKGLKKSTPEGQKAAIKLFSDLIDKYKTDKQLKSKFPGK
jgi:long-chain acyl-CoA synthetase